jgi:hypothetical protein
MKLVLMTDHFLPLIIGTLVLFVGFSKAFWPKWWVELRRRHSWYDHLDFYSFLYKGSRAEKTVRINGYALLILGLVLLIV